jgi:hypothetical protein
VGYQINLCTLMAPIVRQGDIALVMVMDSCTLLPPLSNQTLFFAKWSIRVGK